MALKTGLLAALAVGALLLAASRQAESLPAAIPQPVRIAMPTLFSSATAAVTPTDTPEPAPTSTFEPLVSEVLPATQPSPPPPTPTPVRGGTHLPLPDGTTVVRGGCASDGECHWYNFYWAPTHQVVVQRGEGEHKVQHELCHAHQHWSINAGAPLAPSDYDLESWYSTAEGQSFAATVASASGGWPWSHSAVSGLEDFAWTCAYWYLDPAHLFQVSPERYEWAGTNLP